MSKTLQRYREGTEWGSAVMFPNDKGEYVKHADAQRRIEELEEALEAITEDYKMTSSDLTRSLPCWYQSKNNWHSVLCDHRAGIYKAARALLRK